MTESHEIISQLLALGLTSKQAGVYLACLELGTAQVAQIANRTGEKRTTAYAILQELVRQEFIKATKSGNKYLFSPVDPIKMLDRLEKQKQDMTKLIPFLSEKFSQPGVEPKIEIFRGVQIKELYAKILKAKNKELLMIRSNSNKSKVIGQDFHFGADRRKAGIKARVLLPRNTIKFQNDPQYFVNQVEKLREVRLLPDDLDVSSDVFIFDDTLCIISPQERIGFLLITADYARLMKSIFEMLWQVLLLTK